MTFDIIKISEKPQLDVLLYLRQLFGWKAFYEKMFCRMSTATTHIDIVSEKENNFNQTSNITNLFIIFRPIIAYVPYVWIVEPGVGVYYIDNHICEDCEVIRCGLVQSSEIA